MLAASEDGSVEGSSKEVVELRSRSQRAGSGLRPSRSEEGKSNDKVIIEKKVKPGDSLNKIALQYSVPVSELKRTNNLVAEQDLFALPVVRIPISRLRKELNLEHERELLKNDSPVEDFDMDDMRDDRPLLNGDAGMDRSVEELFEKADASLAQVRDAIPNTPGLEGAFHFVDASSPDQSHKGLWMIIAAVVMMFLIIPLVLTFFEEKSELFEEKENVAHLIRHKNIAES
ncbi:LysM and putative peptidoglycan-binding domain-containing protein 3 [Toxocara canis]|uniref:LysM and putative peptidoglycan-binding domain-containing protein 3 n=1 Tax=Toxocara canis TaxID=6265 RepID=A0A0B2VDY5_TOXCA|nr:LysM and putative peptidoglycan-binding domain-containing protein 3 [Toxocara canis]